MTCASCSAESPAGNKFCGECGAALVTVCAACDSRNPPTNRFCGECGARLESGGRPHAEETRSPEPRPQHPAPDTYTPRHLADRILASREALEGERKQVTVLFA